MSRELAVALLVAGVALQVRGFVELGGVHEQRDNDHVALLACTANQRQVTLV